MKKANDPMKNKLAKKRPSNLRDVGFGFLCNISFESRQFTNLHYDMHLFIYM